jgi:hypothetical protein
LVITNRSPRLRELCVRSSEVVFIEIMMLIYILYSTYFKYSMSGR